MFKQKQSVYVLPAHQRKLLRQLAELLKSDAPTLEQVANRGAA